MKRAVKKAIRAVEVLVREGPAGVSQRIFFRYAELRERKSYNRWLKKHGKVTEAERRQMKAAIAKMPRMPLISVVMPVYNIDERWLRHCLDSVLAQIYENWELCIADDRSTASHVRPVLEEYAARDRRVKIVFREENGHISAASNSALNLASGEFCVLLDHDDELSADALYWVADEIIVFPAVKMIYSDEDLIDESGRRSDPKFKPDFSQDLFYSLNLITHLSAYSTDVLRAIGGFREGFEGSQDYDLALRVIEAIPEREVRHIPRILYHWRTVEGSVARGGDEKPYAHERAREAIREHLARQGKKATVMRAAYNLHRVHYDLPGCPPSVSLILHGLNESAGPGAADIFRRLTDYHDMEIVMASGGSLPGALNAAAARTSGDVICFAGAGLFPGSKSWLDTLVRFALQDGIGAVGGKIITTLRRIAGSGLLIGVNGLATAAHEGIHERAPGNMARNIMDANYSAISAQCLAVTRELFNNVGGFDHVNLPTCYFDVDFCLRLREMGCRMVVTPYAELIDKENRQNVEGKFSSASDAAYFRQRWAEIISRDPFYNPNLSKKNGRFSIDC